jgi:hypothetical protein
MLYQQLYFRMAATAPPVEAVYAGVVQIPKNGVHMNIFKREKVPNSA